MSTATSTPRSLPRLPLASLIMVLLSASVGFGEEITLDQVKQNWEDRTSRIQNLHVLISSTASAENRIRVKDRDNLPPRANLLQTHELRLKNRMFAYKLDTLQGAETGRPRGMRATYDGKFSQFYSGLPSKLGSVSSGQIDPKPYAFCAKKGELLPVLINTRGLILECGGINFNEYVISSRNEDVLGTTCIRLAPANRREYSRVFYCDPSNGFTVRRIEEFVNERLYSLFDISFEPGEEVPSSWAIAILNTETTATTFQSKCAVEKIELNRQILDSEFTFEFPPLTDVQGGPDK